MGDPFTQGQIDARAGMIDYTRSISDLSYQEGINFEVYNQEYERQQAQIRSQQNSSLPQSGTASDNDSGLAAIFIVLIAIATVLSLFFVFGFSSSFWFQLAVAGNPEQAIERVPSVFRNGVSGIVWPADWIGWALAALAILAGFLFCAAALMFMPWWLGTAVLLITIAPGALGLGFGALPFLLSLVLVPLVVWLAGTRFAGRRKTAFQQTVRMKAPPGGLQARARWACELEAVWQVYWPAALLVLPLLVVLMAASGPPVEAFLRLAALAAPVVAGAYFWPLALVNGTTDLSAILPDVGPSMMIALCLLSMLVLACLFWAITRLLQPAAACLAVFVLAFPFPVMPLIWLLQGVAGMVGDWRIDQWADLVTHAYLADLPGLVSGLWGAAGVNTAVATALGLKVAPAALLAWAMTLATIRYRRANG